MPRRPGPPGELGVLAGGQLGVRLAVELDQPLQHDGAGRHVDAQREGLGGEHRPHQAADEQLLDGLLERRQQPGVVRGDAPLQRLAPLPVAQHAEVGLRQVGGAALDDAADLGDLVLGGQPQPGPHALADGGVAAGPAEHEGDRREQAVAVQPVEHRDPRRRPEPDAPGAAPRRGPRRGRGPTRRWRTAGPGRGCAGTRSGSTCSSPSAPSSSANRSSSRLPTIMCCHSGTGRCSSTTTRGVAAHGDQPVAELLGVAHRGRQADQRDVLGQLEDHLLPHRAAEPVGEVVHLVHHDVAEPVQLPGPA